ncbi:MAG: hypothetical protein LBK73_12325 [Treponema sp.]|nr:hypothetical protein [Treponema sp.]
MSARRAAAAAPQGGRNLIARGRRRRLSVQLGPEVRKRLSFFRRSLERAGGVAEPAGDGLVDKLPLSP